MPNFVTGFLGISSLVAALLFYLASSDISENLSPQGCRMSWMSPSYVLQADFNSSWSPLALRYSLWLYREVAWDSVQETGQRKGSLPVLFIPGNAGSSHQVRSIASSATRQYFSSPHVVSASFESRSLKKPLDFFAVEFNEDLSAFHGSTLESQIAYTSQAISYILSLYPPGTTIIIMGHSMGGIVATSLLPSDKISAIITMSTPHALPPARFDSRIDRLYARLQETLEADPTPLVSICGGATDMMIPSESCILPRTPNDIFRRTIFTSALEGAWTGVGHREMVWCHQVRWRVARAALEVGGENNVTLRAVALDKWLRDGHRLPVKFSVDEHGLEVSSRDFSALPSGTKLVLQRPTSSKTYLLPVLEDSPKQKITVLVSRGAIPPVSPEHASSLRVSILSCTDTLSASVQCTPLQPETLKLIPNPIPGRSFPVPQEGSDESEGVVLFETYVPRISGQWIGIKVDHTDGQGWVLAGLTHDKPIVSTTSTFSLLMGPLSVLVPEHEGMSASFTFPNLLSNALVVYRVVPERYLMSSCLDVLLPPLVIHASHPEETHYFPLARGPNRRILLHTHLAAPYIDPARHYPSALNFTIYSSGEPDCRNEFKKFDIAIDWTATMGRWASRYLTTLVSWSAGVAATVVFLAWSHHDQVAPVPTIGQSLARYTSALFRYLLPASSIFSVFPLPESLYLGNEGVVFLAPIAPLILFLASGLVCISWWILVALLTIIGQVSTILFGSRTEKVSVPRSTILSLAIVCATIFLFVPWQVAYLGCWLLHLYTCASSSQYFSTISDRPKTDAVPLIQRSGRRESSGSLPESPTMSSDRRPSEVWDMKRDNLNHNLHILLLMTWLLPLTAPVLAVWVRTLLTAGYTTPFDGDHNFLAVFPFLVLADYASWTPGKLFDRPNFEHQLSSRWLFAIIAGTAFICGSRKPYLVLDVGRVAVWVIVVFKIGRRYWGGLPWSL
ncbi:hypothetical protein GALMADRAFT_219892 [Galerina marginata CBS 339.88]|uniref:GPI inositol-deacylase n=1 Tax=Galerina marginata (strain CBS 339.88) TaxID=685588 RepID=A0A067TP16_GALM3|nr:hypothetical protein GALMADRAFT_219892 [Galerina marginata CBS 339.88]